MMSSRRSLVISGVVILLAGGLFSGCTSRLQSGLQVMSDNVPATVMLDGNFLAQTPYINKSIKPSDYSLEIRPLDPVFVPYQTKVSLKSGMLTVVNWKPGKRPETSGGVILETEPIADKNATELSITTIPDGGIVTVDGVARGFAPVTVTGLTKGEHQFDVKLPSYAGQSQAINLLSGYRVVATVKLAKQDYQALPPLVPSEPTPSPSASASPSIKPSIAPSASPLAKVTPAPSTAVIKKTGFFQNGKEVVRIRAEATSSSAELGFAAVGESLPYLKETKNGWVKVQFNQKTGWISQDFVQITP